MSTDVHVTEESQPNQEFSIKHLLQNEWCMWYLKPVTNMDWMDCLHKLITINTVEDFWITYHHMEKPIRLKPSIEYNLFKEGIKPAWEDVRNKLGGKWTFVTESGKVEEAWLDLLLCTIGEGFGEYSDYVNGVVMQVRQREFRIQVWTSTIDRDAVMHIGRVMKERLSINREIRFEMHQLAFGAGRPAVIEDGEPND